MDLVKALKAMHHCQAWRQSVEAACLFAGKDYGPKVLQDMTRLFLDELPYTESGDVSVPVELGDALLAAVEEWEPPADPVETPPIVEDEQ